MINQVCCLGSWVNYNYSSSLDNCQLSNRADRQNMNKGIKDYKFHAENPCFERVVKLAVLYHDDNSADIILHSTWMRL